jgi:hypothetical protein
LTSRIAPVFFDPAPGAADPPPCEAVAAGAGGREQKVREQPRRRLGRREKMNYRPMLDFHRAKSADATVAVIEVARKEAHQFGVVEAEPFPFKEINLGESCAGK